MVTRRTLIFPALVAGFLLFASLCDWFIALATCPVIGQIWWLYEMCRKTAASNQDNLDFFFRKETNLRSRPKHQKLHRFFSPPHKNYFLNFFKLRKINRKTRWVIPSKIILLSGISFSLQPSNKCVFVVSMTNMITENIVTFFSAKRDFGNYD